MKKKLILSVTSLAITPVFLFSCLLYFCFLSYQQTASNPAVYGLQNSVAYAAVPEDDFFTSSATVKQGSRVDAVRKFFAKYDSPLEPYAQEIIDTADKYGIDYRLLPSIAMQESHLCKLAPEDSYNCWGFGIYGGKITKFTDYPEAINQVAKTLAKDYKKKGMETPEEIVKRYTPSSNGSWQSAVNYFIEQL